MNFRQVKAIEAKNKQRILEICPNADEASGIYIFHRADESGMKFAYVGQAKHLLTRLAQHLAGYQHIDLSIKKHGFKSETNPHGYQINIACKVAENCLDESEKFFIQKAADAGFQLRNKIAGGQGQGKSQIDEYKPAKTYRDGLAQGYLNAQREVGALFEKHLTYTFRGGTAPTVNQQKALEKFKTFIQKKEKN